jgi:hypothetical protein
MSLDCRCERGDARHDEFDSRFVGVDPTAARFAEVTLERCRSCGRLWLRYLVEHEAFSRSGRWARGPISEEDAATITPHQAEPFLNGLRHYLYGGSYFDGRWGRRSGPMDW